MRKLFFFVATTFNKRDYNRFGIEILKAEGFEVHVWDFTPLFSRKAYVNYTPPDTLEYQHYGLIKSKSDFYNLSKNLCNSIVVSHINSHAKTNFIFNYLKQHKIKFGFCNLGLMPSIKFPFMFKILLLFRNPYLIKSKINMFLRKSSNNQIIPNFIITGGEEAIQNNKYLKNNETLIINAHTYDYDLYLNEEKYDNKPLIKDKYAVFLDSFIPFHPDFLHLNMPSYCSANDYYPNINKFFGQVEKLLGLRVVVAAHPRSNYSNQEKLFNNRTVIINQTANLIKYSTFVINHVSTATNFAVLYNKPMVFITSSKYSSRLDRAIKFYAKLFKKKFINLDSDNAKLDLDLNFNVEIYKTYIKNYIKTPLTSEESIWKTFSERIEKII